MKKFLVVGASGTVGSNIVGLLSLAGYPVKATTSKEPQRSGPKLAGTLQSGKGPEWVHLNLATGEGIQKAFDGIQRAFFLSPPGYVDQYQVLFPLVKEAKRRYQRRELEKVVLMTAMGANTYSTSPFRRAELELEDSGIPFNIIRPNWFMQNFHTFWIQGILGQRKILLPAGDAKVSFIDARDISAVAAHLLTKGPFDNMAFDLTGGQALSHQEVARHLSNASGVSISYQEINSSTFEKALLLAGLPPDYAQFLVTLMGFLREGHSARITDSVEKILGREPILFERYAQDYFKRTFKEQGSQA